MRALRHTVVAGDFWLRIAGQYGVTLGRLLTENGATASTPLYVGRTVLVPPPTACWSCANWVPPVDRLVDPTGECHRYPPRTIAHVPGETVPAREWPGTLAEDWCREWTRAT